MFLKCKIKKKQTNKLFEIKSNLHINLLLFKCLKEFEILLSKCISITYML